MKRTSHHVQFQPGGAFYPVALCSISPGWVPTGYSFVPQIAINRMDGSLYGAVTLTEKFPSATEATAEAEQIILNALGANECDATPNRPAMCMTPDGHVIQFGAITAPEGYYLLAAGELYRADDLHFTDYGPSPWQETTRAGVVQNSNQFGFARKFSEKGGE